MNSANTVCSDTLKGLAFEIADLVFITGWAEMHDFKMVIRLDHAVEGEEYEEVVALHSDTRSPCRVIMWRNAHSVFVQPLVGRRIQFASVADALENMLPRQRVILTDIVATSWPTA